MFAVDMTNEMDKTGYTFVKMKALSKAVQVSGTKSPTIGPKSSKVIKIRSERPNACSTPTRKKSARSDEIKSKENITRLYYKKIQSELNKLTVEEAQNAKFKHWRRFQEHDHRIKKLISLESARNEMERLAKENHDINREAHRQNLFMQKQIDLANEHLNYEIERNKKFEEYKREEEAHLKLKTELSTKKKICDDIYQNQKIFFKKYVESIELFHSQEIQSALTQEFNMIKKANENFNAIINKCKTQLDTLNECDVSLSAQYVSDIEIVLEKVKLEIKKIEENKLLEKLKSDKVDEKLKYSADYVEEYNNLQKYLENVESTLKTFINDASLKKFRFECTKAVNKTVNSISNITASHLDDKFRRLLTLLRGEPVLISETNIVSASAHPLGILFSTNLLASKVVKQGEIVVSSKPEAAFALASVIIAIWIEIPEFGQLLMAHFYRVCPYLVPIYWEKGLDMADNEFYQKLGFLYADGEKEELNAFLKRQGGVAKLYSAIIISHKKANHINYQHPMPISICWKWLARFVRLEPKPDISATILLDILETVSDLMSKTYKKQFIKVLHLICKSYLSKIEKITPADRGGPVQRLRNYLEEIGAGKKISPPKTLLPPNFW